MIDATVENILSVYNAATTTQRNEGLRWYRFAHECAEMISPDNVSMGAGVIAALSPRQNWDYNLQIAARAFRNGEATGTLSMLCKKANAIMAGANPLDVLGGVKITNFYLNILDPDSNAGVTIDRHAFDIAAGRVTDDNTRAMLSRKGYYDAFADLYRYAARAIGISAPNLQAITWIKWRADKGL